jgi:hypothetical protein
MQDQSGKVDTKVLKNQMTDDELASVLNKSLEFFDDVVVREQIYRLNVRRAHIKQDIAKLDAMRAELDALATRRTRLFFQAASLFFTLQFGVSYYCIYEVDWLGWDLVEPLTYTLGQGMFVGGVLYSLRNMGQDTLFSSMSAYYKERRLHRYFRKQGVEPARLRYLEGELAKIEAEIRQTERQRYA